jgi:alcohol dehydrogenase
VYPVPEGVSDEQVLMLADILPTGYEVGVLNGGIRPAQTVAIVGPGPIGLATIIGAKLFTPNHIVAIDVAPSRLDAAKQFGADVVVNSQHEDAVARVMSMTDGLGADVAVEAVAIPETACVKQRGSLRRRACVRARLCRPGHGADQPNRSSRGRADGCVPDS